MPTTRHIITSLFFATTAILLFSCETEAPHTGKMELDITEREAHPIEYKECSFKDLGEAVRTPVSGLIESFDKDGNWLSSIDYGDGNCDKWALKTWNIEVYPQDPEGSVVFSVLDHSKRK